jgi:DNA repair protein RadC
MFIVTEANWWVDEKRVRTRPIQSPIQFVPLSQRELQEKKVELCFALCLDTQAARIVYEYTRVSGHKFEPLKLPGVTVLSVASCER